MSEADAEDWYSAGEVLDQINADAGVLRPARTGRHHDALRLHILNVSNRDLVVAVNLDRSSEFAQILDEVVSKRIVIVEYEDH
jgi:hypothetical protein